MNRSLTTKENKHFRHLRGPPGQGHRSVRKGSNGEAVGDEVGRGHGSRSGRDFLLKVMHGGQGCWPTDVEWGSACWVILGPCPRPPLTCAEVLGLAPGAPQGGSVCSHLHVVGCASPQANKGDLCRCGFHGQLCRGRQPWIHGLPLLPGGWAWAVGYPWSHRLGGHIQWEWSC